MGALCRRRVGLGGDCIHFAAGFMAAAVSRTSRVDRSGAVMGMLLIMLSVDMLLDNLQSVLHISP